MSNVREGGRESRFCHLRATLQGLSTKHADSDKNMGFKGNSLKKQKRVTWYFHLLNIDSSNTRITDTKLAVLLSSRCHFCLVESHNRNQSSRCLIPCDVFDVNKRGNRPRSYRKWVEEWKAGHWKAERSVRRERKTGSLPASPSSVLFERELAAPRPAWLALEQRSLHPCAVTHPLESGNEHQAAKLSPVTSVSALLLRNLM